MSLEEEFRDRLLWGDVTLKRIVGLTVVVVVTSQEFARRKRFFHYIQSGFVGPTGALHATDGHAQQRGLAVVLVASAAAARGTAEPAGGAAEEERNQVVAR